MENNYYDKIAWDYHLKRKKPWKALEEFLDHLKEKKYNFKGYCIDSVSYTHLTLPTILLV